MRLRNYRFGFSVSVAACSAYASYAMANRGVLSKSPTPASGSNDKYDDEEDDTDDNDGSGGEEADTEVREARKEKEATERNTQAIALVKERRPTDRVVGRKLKRRPMFSRGKRSKVVASVKRERANTLDEVRRRG